MGSETQLKPRFRVFLDITGFRGKPESITKLLGIDPDEAWSKGDVMPELGPGYRGPKPNRRKYSCWTIRASLKKYSYEVEDYIKDIIRRISPVRDKIKEIPGANLWLRAWIEIYPDASMPAIGLSIETMRFLSDIGAEFDLDLALILDPEKSERLQT